MVRVEERIQYGDRSITRAAEAPTGFAALRLMGDLRREPRADPWAENAPRNPDGTKVWPSA